jgi:predicted nucleotidyltransferase
MGENRRISRIVEFEESRKTFDNYMELKFLLQDLPGVKVDLITVKALKPRVRKYVLKDGILSIT